MAYKMKDVWIDIDEATTHLGVKPATVRSWISDKNMLGKKISRCWNFKFSKIDEWVKSGKSAIEL